MHLSRLEALNPRRSRVARHFRQPHGRIWLRVLARGMEILSDMQPKQISYSQITDQIAVGGAFRPDQIGHLVARGVTAVVDCRAEARGPERAVRQAGLNFLHAPAPDRHAPSFAQLKSVVEWVNCQVADGGRAFLHCEHGVGRGPMLAAAVLVTRGYTASEAVRIVRANRWQALPNDRQLDALLAFEREWHRPQTAAS
jgi:hypothetical protein